MIHEDKSRVWVEAGQNQAKITAATSEVHDNFDCLHVVLFEERRDILHLLPLPGPPVSSEQLIGIFKETLLDEKNLVHDHLRLTLCPLSPVGPASPPR